MSLLLEAMIVILILFILVIGIIHYENKNFVVTHYMIDVDKVDLEGKRIDIAFLSDLHNCAYGEKNEKLYDAIVRQNPDLIAIGGDMIVKEPESTHEEALALIRRLAKHYPIVYANGNHEKKLELIDNKEQSHFIKYIDELKKLGVQFVNNANTTITIKGTKIEVTGLDLDLSYYKKFDRKKLTKDELKQMLPKQEKSAYQILLAHNPIYFDSYAESNYDLILSGHVHGGLVILPWIGGVLSTQLALFPKYDFGRFTKKNATMVLSRGLGSHTIKVRFNNRPEVVMVHLRDRNKKGS
ncbi:hypothetical protein lbkm_0819 [Lachnospiraceae bacterium KM106-2]|nr:hypothetical protein lbkm_0819 [Lachnospiraceae bacterium KM106-2]